MSGGPPVTIVVSGGRPITPVLTGAPVLNAVQSGGAPVTIAPNGQPFVVININLPNVDVTRPVLSNAEIDATSDIGDTVGTFQPAVGLTLDGLTNDGGGLFELAGSRLKVASFLGNEAGDVNITIDVTNGTDTQPFTYAITIDGIRDLFNTLADSDVPGEDIEGFVEQVNALNAILNDIEGGNVVIDFTQSASSIVAALDARITAIEAADVDAPVLAQPSAVQTGATTADLAVFTDEVGGAVFVALTASATKPTPQQVEAGQDHTGATVISISQPVNSLGEQAIPATSLTAETGYYAHFMHKDAAGNRSDVVSSAQFTTAGGANTTAFVTPDFDAANFDEAASTITDAATSTPTVRFLPKLGGASDYNNNFANVYGRVSGMNSKTATIEIDGTDRNDSPRPLGSNWGIVWRYLGESRDDWKVFDTQTESGNVTQGVNNAAFSQDVVEVAFKPRWTEGDYATLWGELTQSQYVSEPLSSVNRAGGLDAYTHAELNPGTITTNLVPASPVKMRCLKLGDANAAPTDGLPKQSIVLLMGQHAGEDQGDYFAAQFLEYLTGNTASGAGYAPQIRLLCLQRKPARKALWPRPHQRRKQWRRRSKP